MPLTHRTGDLFAATDLDAVAHGCNCVGVMGAGIAAVFADRHPAMRDAYRQHCKDGTFTLGSVFPWSRDGRPVVYNLATQEQPGPCADLDAIVVAVEKMLVHAEGRGYARVGIPRIGAGIGGLDWTDVEEALEMVADGYPGVELVVFTLPGQG